MKADQIAAWQARPSIGPTMAPLLLEAGITVKTSVKRAIVFPLQT